MSARVSRPPMLTGLPATHRCIIIMNGQLTGYDQSANELASNLNTVKYHFSLDNYDRLLRMKRGGATAGCPSDWMGTGIKFAVTFLGSGRATTMTGYGTDHPLEEGETAVTSQFVIKLSASNQPGNVSAPIVLWCRTEHELVVLIPTSERKFFRVEMNTTTGSAIIQKVCPARGPPPHPHTTPSPRYPTTPSPHHPITPSPRHPVTP